MRRISALCAAAAIGCADGLAAMNRVGVVFDIDGTLVNSQGQVPIENKRAILYYHLLNEDIKILN